MPQNRHSFSHCVLQGSSWLFACVVAVACSSSKDTTGGTTTSPTASAGQTSSAGGSTATAGSYSATPKAGTTASAGTSGRPAATSGNGAAPATGGTPAATGGNTAPATAGMNAATSGSGGTASVPAGDGSASVLQYHKDAKRTGMYADAAFTRAAAANLKKDPSFNATVAGPTYAQPLYFDAGAAGTDLVIVATEQNEVTAFNAADGSVVWRKTLDMPATSGLACGNITPLGVTGTPVIDAASRTLYVAAMTAGPKHQVYALSLDDGSSKAGFPVDLSTMKSGALAFNSAEQNQRGALIIVKDMLYVPYGGLYGDCGNYHGWVMGIPLNASSAPIAFATKAHAGGIWAPGGLASDGTSVFAATGNTMADGGGILSSPSSWGHGDAILRLGTDLKTIAESDTKNFFAAENWSQLDAGDLDLGGSGPILFTAPGAMPSELAVAMGKGGGAYLLSLENLGGMGGMLDMKMVASGGIAGGMIQAATAYSTPTGTFVAFRAAQQVSGCASGTGYIGALKIDTSGPAKMSVAWCAGSNGSGSPISTTTDGMAESIVWYVANGKLLGFNGENGMPIYTGGGAGDSAGTPNKFQTPIVAKGRMFLASGNSVIAYTLK